MSDISERLIVRCPMDQAARQIARFIRTHGNSDGDVVRVRLRVPLDLFGVHRSSIERPVIATLNPLRSIADPLPAYSVTWASENGGPFPMFAGALAVEPADHAGSTFRLVVSGHYDPPFGAAGAAFDATLGRRIAHASARDLLHTIANDIEYAYAHGEAAKAGRRI